MALHKKLFKTIKLRSKFRRFENEFWISQHATLYKRSKDLQRRCKDGAKMAQRRLFWIALHGNFLRFYGVRNVCFLEFYGGGVLQKTNQILKISKKCVVVNFFSAGRVVITFFKFLRLFTLLILNIILQF